MSDKLDKSSKKFFSHYDYSNALKIRHIFAYLKSSQTLKRQDLSEFSDSDFMISFWCILSSFLSNPLLSYMKRHKSQNVSIQVPIWGPCNYYGYITHNKIHFTTNLYITSQIYSECPKAITRYKQTNKNTQESHISIITVAKFGLAL